jgi:hypothetical protein
MIPLGDTVGGIPELSSSDGIKAQQARYGSSGITKNCPFRGEEGGGIIHFLISCNIIKNRI